MKSVLQDLLWEVSQQLQLPDLCIGAEKLLLRHPNLDIMSDRQEELMTPVIPITRIMGTQVTIIQASKVFRGHARLDTDQYHTTMTDNITSSEYFELCDNFTTWIKHENVTVTTLWSK